MSACRSCGAPIAWAVSAKTGLRMPLDSMPVEAKGKPKAGLFTLMLGRQEGELVAITANWFYAGTSPLLEHPPAFYQSHFATCPNADQHRRSSAPNPDPRPGPPKIGDGSCAAS